MLGNDIVDLEATRKSNQSSKRNWQRPGFIEKIFTGSEQKLIADSKDKFIAVWKLWSMKESAYKVFIQAGGERFFNPKRIECQNNRQNGKVEIGDLKLTTETSINERYIFTVAGIDDFEHESKIYQLNNKGKLENDVKSQSQNLRNQLLLDFSQKYKLELKKLKIEKIQNGVPRLFYDGKDLGLVISLTHCGVFGGFSYCPEIPNKR